MHEHATTRTRTGDPRGLAVQAVTEMLTRGRSLSACLAEHDAATPWARREPPASGDQLLCTWVSPQKTRVACVPPA